MTWWKNENNNVDGGSSTGHFRSPWDRAKFWNCVFCTILLTERQRKMLCTKSCWQMKRGTLGCFLLLTVTGRVGGAMRDPWSCSISMANHNTLIFCTIPIISWYLVLVSCLRMFSELLLASDLKPQKHDGDVSLNLTFTCKTVGSDQKRRRHVRFNPKLIKLIFLHKQRTSASHSDNCWRLLLVGLN